MVMGEGARSHDLPSRQGLGKATTRKRKTKHDRLEAIMSKNGSVRLACTVQELTNNSKKFKPGGWGVETLLFQTGCFAFRSPTRIDLFLKRNSSVMSVSLHNLGGDLYTAASSISVFLIGIQTHVASTGRRRNKSTRVWGMSFLTPMAVPPLCHYSRSVRYIS
jgi:hypothetical protein